MVVCRILGLTKTHRLPNDVTCSEHQYYKNKPIALIWPWIQFLDVAIFVVLWVYVPLMVGFTVVCDRFVPDILVELMIDVKDDKLHEKLVGRLILRMKPQSAIVFLLDVNEAIASRRKLDIPNLRYLTCRRNNYRKISHYLGIPSVDAEQPFIRVHQHIIKQIETLNIIKMTL
jgi:thymidylate kinase